MTFILIMLKRKKRIIIYSMIWMIRRQDLEAREEINPKVASTKASASDALFLYKSLVYVDVYNYSAFNNISEINTTIYFI